MNNEVNVNWFSTDARGTITYTYDARDRLLSETQPDGTRLSYLYDAVGNRTQLTQTLPDNSQRITRYGFDVLNRLVQVTSPSNTVTTYAYDAAGNRVYTQKGTLLVNPFNRSKSA